MKEENLLNKLISSKSRRFYFDEIVTTGPEILCGLLKRILSFLSFIYSFRRPKIASCGFTLINNNANENLELQSL